MAQGRVSLPDPDTGAFEELIAKERRESYQYGSRRVFGKARSGDDPPKLF